MAFYAYEFSFSGIVRPDGGAERLKQQQARSQDL